MFNLFLTGGDALLCIILSASFVVALNKVCIEGQSIYLNFQIHLYLFESFIVAPKKTHYKFENNSVSNCNYTCGMRLTFI